jgi:hypothetical protein
VDLVFRSPIKQARTSARIRPYPLMAMRQHMISLWLNSSFRPIVNLVVLIYLISPIGGWQAGGFSTAC